MSNGGKTKTRIADLQPTTYPPVRQAGNLQPAPTPLESAIFATIRFFDLLQLPLTATQIWRNLIITTSDSPLRWQGHRAYALRDITTALRDSAWLQARITTQWGYYCRHGQQASIAQRLRRHTYAQLKFKIVRFLARLVAHTPLVAMIAISGSLAFANPRQDSDLDVIVVAKPNRIWLTRLLVTLVTQATGRRRKYWDQAAPDKLCLNHYLTTDTLTVDPEIRNLYTALLYLNIVPVYGVDVFANFVKDNHTWYKRFVMYPPSVMQASTLAILPLAPLHRLKQWLDRLLIEPVGAVLENIAERIQRRAIVLHTIPGQAGRVAVSSSELAFHPFSKVDGILQQFSQDEGQRTLV